MERLITGILFPPLICLFAQNKQAIVMYMSNNPKYKRMSLK